MHLRTNFFMSMLTVAAVVPRGVLGLATRCPWSEVICILLSCEASWVEHRDGRRWLVRSPRLDMSCRET